MEIQGRGKKEHQRGQRFSEILGEIRVSSASSSASAKNRFTLGDLIETVGPKGHVFLCVFLVLPFLQPIPLPGISTAFGLTIAVLGVFLVLGKDPWIPKRFAEIPLEPQLVVRICSTLESLVEKIESLIRPRGLIFIRNNWIKRFNGISLVFHALLLSLPLPIPFSNFLPAATVFLIALGILEEDLVVVACGYLLAFVTFVFFLSLILIPFFTLQMGAWSFGTGP